MSATAALEASWADAADSHTSSRELVVAWQHPTDRTIHPIGLLRSDGDVYSFRYIRAVLTVPGFRPLLGFGRLDEVYVSDRLFPLFAQRAMDPRRSDYTRYVTELGLDPADATPWEQITRSTGRRNGDTLQLFPVPREVAGRIACSFLVHGVRHMPENDLVVDGDACSVTAADIERLLGNLSSGAVLSLVPEPTNARNAEAILVVAQGVPFGYVPDLLVHDLHRLMALADVRASVLRVNGLDAPAHLRVLAEFHASGAGGFRFFADERWLPLP